MLELQKPKIDLSWTIVVVAAWLTILNANHTQGPLTTYPVIYAKSSRKVQTTLQLGLHSIAQSIGSPAKSISKTKKLLSFQYNALLDKLTLWLNI